MSLQDQLDTPLILLNNLDIDILDGYSSNRCTRSFSPSSFTSSDSKSLATSMKQEPPQTSNLVAARRNTQELSCSRWVRISN